MKTLMKCVFGSHLYGTNTENSDRDYKAVHLPSREDLYLRKVKDTIVSNTKVSATVKNGVLDTDSESYCLQYFLLTLGSNGDTTFLDMIHAPEECLLISSPEWEFMQRNRARFYTKSLRSYVGYVRAQSSKYGIRGSKLEEASKLLQVLNNHNDGQRLADFFDELPDSEYSKRYDIANCSTGDRRTFDFCGKKLMATTNVFFAKQTVQQFYNSYGERARKAQANEGIDWKAVSHAIRVGYQLKELYTTGDLVFPLKEAKLLTEIKQGKLHYVKDNVAETLEKLVEEVEVLASKSSFPEKVDMQFWEDWIVDLYKEE